MCGCLKLVQPLTCNAFKKEQRLPLMDNSKNIIQRTGWTLNVNTERRKMSQIHCLMSSPNQRQTTFYSNKRSNKAVRPSHSSAEQGISVFMFVFSEVFFPVREKAAVQERVTDTRQLHIDEQTIPIPDSPNIIAAIIYWKSKGYF